MQISAPTQAPNTALENVSSGNGSPAEELSAKGVSGDSPDIWESRSVNGAAQKRGKGGIFAKLLEGLTEKGKKDGSKTEKTEDRGVKTDELSFLSKDIDNLVQAEGESASVAAEKDTQKADFLSKNTKSIENSEEIFDSEAVIGTVSASFRQDAERSGVSGKTGSEAVRAARKTDTLEKTELSEAGNANFAETVTEEFAAAVHEQDAVSGLASKNSAKGENPLFTGGDAAEKSRHARADSPAAGTEHGGDALFLSQGVPGGPNSLNSENGGKDNAPLQEVRGKKGREKFHIEVRDLRTAQAREAEAANGTNSGPKGTAFEAARPGFTEIELPVDLGFSSGRGTGKTGSTPSQRFEDALARELRGNLSADIVRDATVIVRNGGEGIIRLSLRPESLGNVKIRLEMTENKITGHIIVESNEAFRAFERELPVLEKAFRDSGFSETNLQMSLSQDGSNYGSGGQRQEGDIFALLPAAAASRYEAGTGGEEDAALPALAVSAAAPGRTQVNLLI